MTGHVARPPSAVPPPPIVDQPIRHHRRTEILALLIMGGLYFWSFFQRVAVPGSVFNEVQTDLGLSAAGVTALASVYLYIYATMQIFVGLMADRIGPTRPMLFGGLLLAAGSLLFPLSPSAFWLYATRAMVALGGSFMYICIIKQIDLIFESKHFARLVGMMLFMGYAGGVVAGVPAKLAVTAVGWRNMLLLAGGLCAAVAAAGFVLLRSLPRPAGRRSELASGALGAFFRNRRNYPWMIGGSIMFTAYMTLQATIGQKFLQDRAGLPPSLAASVTTAMQVALVLTAVVSSLLPPLIGNRRKPILLAALLLTLAASAVLAASAFVQLPLWLVIAAMIAEALALGTTPVSTALIREINSPSVTAFAIALCNAANYLTVAIFNNLAGVMMDWYAPPPVEGQPIIYPATAWQAVFTTLLVMNILGTAVGFFIPETRGEQVGHR